MLESLEQRIDASANGLSDLASELVASRTDGRIKLFVIRQLLNYRREHHDLFTTGQYLPVELSGARRENVCAFCRKSADAAVIVVVPRLIGGLLGLSGQPPIGQATWDDSRLVLPKGLAGRRFANLFTNEELAVSDDSDAATLSVADVLKAFPVAVLTCLATNG